MKGLRAENIYTFLAWGYDCLQSAPNFRHCADMSLLCDHELQLSFTTGILLDLEL
jgi:hypothetical protein